MSVPLPPAVGDLACASVLAAGRLRRWPALVQNGAWLTFVAHAIHTAWSGWDSVASMAACTALGCASAALASAAAATFARRGWNARTLGRLVGRAGRASR